jgi:hypothetical protein
MNGAMRKIVILIGSLSLLALPLVASAEESEEDSAPADDSQLVYHYDSNAHLLLYGFFAPGTDPETCTPAAPVTEETTDDGGVVDAATDAESTGDDSPVCEELLFEGFGAKLNHGSFLSSFVRAFKAGFESDRPFGQYVREFAKSDLGKTEKTEKAEKGSDDGEAVETDDEDGSGKPDKAPKTNNGNGHGKGKKGS